MPTKRTEFGEHENRTPGDRRTPCMAVDSKLCDEKHHYMAQLIDHRFDAMDEALTLRTREIDNHFTHLNNSQTRLDKDRDEFLRIREYKINHKNLEEKIENSKEVIERNSIRLTNIENLYATEKTLDLKIATLKEFHEIDLKPIRTDIQSFKQLVWIGIGIVIAAQVLLHYYFLK